MSHQRNEAKRNKIESKCLFKSKVSYHKKASKQQTKMPSRRSTCQERKVYETDLEGIARDIRNETGSRVDKIFELKYRYKDPQGRFETEIEGFYIPGGNIMLKKFRIIKEGVTILQRRQRGVCKPYPGLLSYICREETAGWHESEPGIQFKPENAWTKCEIFYKGRWVKAHTVRECIELKGRLEFFDCE